MRTPWKLVGECKIQHIMQNVLAPFLWIFALVYIDDIIIFSLTFEDHLSHLDQVFQAIEKSGVTLAITKCHFGYQSLLFAWTESISIRTINAQGKGRCHAAIRRTKELP